MKQRIRQFEQAALGLIVRDRTRPIVRPTEAAHVSSGRSTDRPACDRGDASREDWRSSGCHPPADAIENAGRRWSAADAPESGSPAHRGRTGAVHDPAKRRTLAAAQSFRPRPAGIGSAPPSR